MKDWIVVVLYMVAMAVVCIGGPLTLAYCYDSAVCHIKARAMGKDCTWGPLQGCMIQVNGAWVPLEAYRTVD